MGYVCGEGAGPAEAEEGGVYEGGGGRGLGEGWVDWGGGMGEGGVD